MILHAEGIYYGIGGLYITSEELVKAVLVDAFCTYGTVEATEAAALEWILSNIYHTAGIRTLGTEAVDHHRKI
jgi:hypothetical protein